MYASSGDSTCSRGEFVALDHLVVFIDHRGDRVRLNFHPVVGDYRVRARHLHRRHFDSAEHDRRVCRQIAKAELRRHRADSIQSDAVRQPRRRRVERLAERELERDVAEESVAIVIRRPAHVAVLPRERRILDVASRQKLLRAARKRLVEGRQVCHRLEHRARLTFGLSNAIELARAVIAPAGHRPNLSALRLERDQARLEPILGLAPRELGMLRFEVG